MPDFTEQVRQAMREKRAQPLSHTRASSPPDDAPLDLGSGARQGPLAPASTSAAMSGWMRDRARQLGTRAEHVTIPSRRS
jgi:hypothetical protein